MTKIYGYLIDSTVLYLPYQQQLISNKGGTCQLRNTMSQLLYFLMLHGDEGVITDDDILFNVWEKNELSGTRCRLWQVMQDLKRKLNTVGIDTELFMRVKGKGYYLNPNKITPLYTRAQSIKPVINHAQSM